MEAMGLCACDRNNVVVAVLLENFIKATEEKTQGESAMVVRWHPLDPLLESLAHFDSPQDLHQRIDDLFGVLDVDGDRRLSFERLREGLQRLRIFPTIEITEEDFDRITEDRRLCDSERKLDDENFQAVIRCQLSLYIHRQVANALQVVGRDNTSQTRPILLMLKLFYIGSQGLVSVKNTNAGSSQRTSSSSQYAAGATSQKSAEVQFSMAKSADLNDHHCGNAETGQLCDPPSVAAVAVSAAVEAAVAEVAAGYRLLLEEAVTRRDRLIQCLEQENAALRSAAASSAELAVQLAQTEKGSCRPQWQTGLDLFQQQQQPHAEEPVSEPVEGCAGQAPSLVAMLLRERMQVDNRRVMERRKEVPNQPLYMNTNTSLTKKQTRHEHKSPKPIQLQEIGDGDSLVAGSTAGAYPQQIRCSSAPPSRCNVLPESSMETRDAERDETCQSTPIHRGSFSKEHESRGSKRSFAWRALWPSPGVPGWTRIWSSDSEWNPPTPPPETELSSHQQEHDSTATAASPPFGDTGPLETVQSLGLAVVGHAERPFRRGVRGPAIAALPRHQRGQGLGHDYGLRASGVGSAHEGIFGRRWSAPPVRGTGPAAQGASRVLSPIRV